MKKTPITPTAALLALSLLFPAAVSAGDDGAMKKDTSSRVSQTQGSTAYDDKADRPEGGLKPEVARDLKLIDGNLIMGSDLHDHEGRKLGDIVDLALDLENHGITHVLVMTGGFLDMGGDVRALPANAIKRQDGLYRTDLSEGEFLDREVMPDDHLQALQSDYGERLDRLHGQTPVNQSAASSRQPREDRAEERDLVLFSDLSGYGIAFSDDQSDTAVITGALVDVAEKTIAFIEVRGIERTPFEALPVERRLMIPATEIEAVDKETSTLRFGIPVEEARNADSIQDVDSIEQISTDDGRVYSLTMN
jgi:sporulation protein YlmC with PRC-barrel domain